jgi:prepilin-type N-terminal cleavage/methylation domain-containing protein
MTLIELSIAIVVLGIIMSIAVAALFRARISANEGAAIAALRTVNTAQFQYQASCGQGLYAQSLAVLGRPAAGETEGFIPGELGNAVTSTRSGYTFTVGIGAGGAASTPDCNGTATVSRYYATAVPAEPDTGTRAFATSQAGEIWQAMGVAAPAEPFGPPATIVE